MPDIRSHRDPRHKRSAAHVCVIALVLAMAWATVSGVASSGNIPRAAARAVPALGSSPRLSGAATLGGNDPTYAGAPLAVPAGPAPGAPPRTVARTMSMDAPIQGGLTAHQEQTLSTRLLSSHRVASAAPQGEYWTPAMGRSAVTRAESWLGMPYSWAGGGATGPTAGRCDPGNGSDLDCHVVGFDCSGLTMYAWGTYLALPHLADTQQEAGAFHPALTQLLPGDLVFFSAYLPGGTGHVAIYTGSGMVIEAPQSGSVIRRSTLSDAMAEGGVYRGAVRPLTGQTPTLTAPRVAVRAGGVVTLHGAHLAGVDAVHLGGVTVRQFVQRSDSAIVFHTAAHRSGTVTVTVSTSWKATSQPVNLTYAQPRPPPPTIAPTTPAPPTSSSTPKPSPTPPVSTPSVSKTGSPGLSPTR